MPKKSRGQKRQAKTKKRQHRQVRRSSPPSVPFLGGMPFGSAPEVPQGFRPMSMTQAMLEYAAPLMAYVEDGTVQDPNDALQIGVQLWNITLPKSRCHRSHHGRRSSTTSGQPSSWTGRKRRPSVIA